MIKRLRLNGWRGLAITLACAGFVPHLLTPGIVSAQEPKPGAPPPSDQPIVLKVTSATVRDAQNIAFGRIEEIVVDPSSGKIEFAFVANTVFTNNGIATITPIPWRLLAPRGDQVGRFGSPGINQNLQVNLERAKLMKAPSFDRRKWPDFSKKDWSHPYLSYYGSEAGGSEGKASPPPDPAPTLLRNKAQ